MFICLYMGRCPMPRQRNFVPLDTFIPAKQKPLCRGIDCKKARNANRRQYSKSRKATQGNRVIPVQTRHTKGITAIAVMHGKSTEVGEKDSLWKLMEKVADAIDGAA